MMINQYLLHLFLWLCPLSAFAVSSIGQFDNLIGITLKNHRPCFYMNHHTAIGSIYIATKWSNGSKPIPSVTVWQQSDIGQSGKHTGHDVDHCVRPPHHVRMMPNVPYQIYVVDIINQIPNETHIRSFCIRQIGQKRFIASVDYHEDEQGRIDFFCSDKPLPPYSPPTPVQSKSWWDSITAFFAGNFRVPENRK